VVGKSSVSVAPGQTRTIDLIVIGAGNDPVVVSSPDLPAFATLVDMMLTLSPSATDAGSYDIQLVATLSSDAGQCPSSKATLSVTVLNTAPSFLEPVPLQGVADAVGLHRSRLGPFNVSNMCPGPYCQLRGPVSLTYVVCDADLDDLSLDVEVVDAGSPLAGIATVSKTVSLKNAPSGGDCATITVGFPPLSEGQAYDYAFRVRDAAGLVPTNAPDPILGVGGVNWYQGGTFQQGPCDGGGCRCGPKGSQGCQYDSDCCSGSCDRTLQTGPWPVCR
jgi:hypothetical protein